MEQAAHGDEVYFREDHARVAFSVPTGSGSRQLFRESETGVPEKTGRTEEATGRQL